MKVVGAEEVEAAAAAGVLTVGPRDIVTPLANERARELGVQLVVGTPGTAAAVVGDRLASAGRGSPRPGSPRPGVQQGDIPPTQLEECHPAAIPGGPIPGGPMPGGPNPGGSSPGAQPAAVPLFAAAPPLPMPPAGALFRRGAPLPGPVRGAGGFTGRVVVVGAGNVGTITALRLAESDVFTEIVLVDVDEGRAQGVALDLTHAAALAGFATRVRGTGVVEDAGPADYVVITAGRARQPGMSRSDLVSTNAAVVGDVATRVASTCPDAVILVVTDPLDEMTQHAWRVSGFPSHRVLGVAEVDSGAEDVGLLRSANAFVAPGAAAARMVLAMAADSDQVMTAAVLADGSYGIRDVYVGLPVRLGRHGLREIVHLDLRADELAALRAAADRIRDRVGQLTP